MDIVGRFRDTGAIKNGEDIEYQEEYNNDGKLIKQTRQSTY
jgi:hypothetical protein